MGQDLKCFFGLHKYEVLKEDYIRDYRDNIIGKVIINRCNNCGKIKATNIITIKEYVR